MTSQTDSNGKAFAAWFHRELTKRGYDLSKVGGGRAKFASAAGVSASTVGRLLRGEMTADVRILGQVATALGYPVGDVLVRAGVLSADELQAARTPDRERPMTPEEAAAELGIVDPIDRDAFAAMVIAMQQRNQDRQ
ncbi:helix-turn-helix transcriptional regulator [Streptomyces carpaticus]|uniref:helix-turn-helix domain-containing protein n=1 Tax=Streptomyces carpaticus TaxID=285558 RepID=UPI002207038D|nr:helix-turn-helix transcriptional regulator [Streptomyces carpaticus]